MSRASPFADRRLMSISRNEFATSIAKLGCHRTSASGHPVFDLDGNASVEIHFADAPPKTLGGLLALPQAVVTLVFSDSNNAARDAFVRRFDIAFQRGGG